MKLPQPRRQMQHPLHAFEFIEPILRDRGQEWILADSDAGGARRAGLLPHHDAVLAERAIAKPPGLEAVLAEEDDDGHAIAAADLQRLLHVGVVVAVEIANLNRRRDGCEML